MAQPATRPIAATGPYRSTREPIRESPERWPRRSTAERRHLNTSISSNRQVIPVGPRKPCKHGTDAEMATVSAFTDNNLNGQGFGYLDLEAKYRYALPLRFTPAVATMLIVIGLVFQSPIWLGSMALVAPSGALFSRGMVIDLVYNYGVRHLFHSRPLPPTPKPRQFSYFLSASSLAGAALSFAFGLPVLGFILGGMVVIGATILTTTLWCLGSWIYRTVFGPRLRHRSAAEPRSTVERGQAAVR